MLPQRMTALTMDTARMGENELDRALVERVQQGDKRAFDLLVRKYQHKLIGLVSRYVRSHAECEDIAQESFIRAWRAIGSFRGDSAFYTWLYKIAVNTAKNHLVAMARRPPSGDIDVGDAEFIAGAERMHDSATPERELMRQEIEQSVFSTVQALPEELRTAITLKLPRRWAARSVRCVRAFSGRARRLMKNCGHFCRTARTRHETARHESGHPGKSFRGH
jgi:RNA polymerase sigma-70 factor (ECF subfamily)